MPPVRRNFSAHPTHYSHNTTNNDFENALRKRTYSPTAIPQSSLLTHQLQTFASETTSRPLDVFSVNDASAQIMRMRGEFQKFTGPFISLSRPTKDFNILNSHYLMSARNVKNVEEGVVYATRNFFLTHSDKPLATRSKVLENLQTGVNNHQFTKIALNNLSAALDTREAKAFVNGLYQPEQLADLHNVLNSLKSSIHEKINAPASDMAFRANSLLHDISAVAHQVVASTNNIALARLILKKKADDFFMDHINQPIATREAIITTLIDHINAPNLPRYIAKMLPALFQTSMGSMFTNDLSPRLMSTLNSRLQSLGKINPFPNYAIQPDTFIPDFIEASVHIKNRKLSQEDQRIYLLDSLKEFFIDHAELPFVERMGVIMSASLHVRENNLPQFYRKILSEAVSSKQGQVFLNNNAESSSQQQQSMALYLEQLQQNLRIDG